MIYLDWAATAMPREDLIRLALQESFDFYGNPSSPHCAGFKAKEILESMRNRCGELLNTDPQTLYFTSGGSESNSIVLFSFLKKHGQGEILLTSIEHPSVSEPIKSLDSFGWKTKELTLNTNGLVNLNKLSKSINENTKLVSIIYVHNETGVIQPLEEIINIVRSKEVELNKKIHIHIDGVQPITKTPVDLSKLDIDSFSISGHKFGSPRGTGILYLKNSKEVLVRGGGQEMGIRPGTENLFGIIALTKCLEESLKTFNERNSRLNGLMDRLIQGASEIGINTIPKERTSSSSMFVPNIVSMYKTPIAGEVLVRVLNSKGFMISTGSACSSNRKSNTKGILSMGITNNEGFASFRVSIGYKTTFQDIENFLKALKESVNELAP